MNSINLSVYTGLAATGKTSTIIKSMRKHKEQGGKVALFLSAEHPELTRRKNVRPGGLMGCRDPELNFPIDYVLKTQETIEQLEALEPGTMAVFDEAQYFKPEIVSAWHDAAGKGLEILVGTPSSAQLKRLRKSGHDPIELTVPCRCGKADATTVVYEENMTYPTHLCNPCHDEQHQAVLDELFDEVEKSDPFPGEKKTYQPFFDVHREGWDYVRADSLARFELMEKAVARCPALKNSTENSGVHFSFLDLGCCSGFFSDAMASLGFSSMGVDVTKNFIDWAGRLAKLKGQTIEHTCQDAKLFLDSSDDMIDVTSTFATLQWVMTQQGYEAGLDCFKTLFNRTRHVCVVEMGYTLEEIYKKRIPDRPREIDKNWVLDIMQEYGNFAEIEVHPAGENGIWRDVFIGFKEVPEHRPFRRQFETEAVDQISIAQQAWDDKWIGSDFEVFFKTKKALSQGKLSGWIPDRDDNAPSDIAVLLNGVEVHKTTVEENNFEITFDCAYGTGERFGLVVQSTALNMDNKDDNRPLAFVLKELTFV